MKSFRIYFNLRISLYQSGKSLEKVRYTHDITTSSTPQKTRYTPTVAGFLCLYRPALSLLSHYHTLPHPPSF
jgi:hypothetical protein